MDNNKHLLLFSTLLKSINTRLSGSTQVADKLIGAALGRAMISVRFVGVDLCSATRPSGVKTRISYSQAIICKDSDIIFV